MPGIDETKQFVPLKIAVLTVSDTRSLKDDKSGALLVQRIVAAGHLVAERSIVTDDIEAIRARVKAWIADPMIDVVITTGGTGFTGRDVTPEAVEPLFEKKMDGVLGAVPGGELSQDRHLGDPVARHRRRRRLDLYFLPAGLARRLQGRLGRNSGAPARLPLRAVQFRRDHAAARRAFAPAEGEGRDGLVAFAAATQLARANDTLSLRLARADLASLRGAPAMTSSQLQIPVLADHRLAPALVLSRCA